LRNHSADLTINPLPQRFGKGAHLLMQQFRDRNNFFNEKTMFEPNMTDYIITASKLNDKQPQQQAVHHTPTGVRHSARSVASHFYHQPTIRNLRVKRQTTSLTTAAQQNKSSSKYIPDVLHVETAIFVDKDLFRHMSKNFPKDTESQMIRFVLAMVNGVQLLYNHPSLGKKINFVLKRLEILHSDPMDLQRSSDIDIYLNSFCQWQRKLNPVSDSDILHFDHAVILTGMKVQSF
jgi:Reprolysin (M12B) family zinc metalloprotease